MDIKVTETLITRLKNAGFYPDTMMSAYIVLKCLQKQDIKLLDTLDDDSTSKRMILLYYDLLRRELVDTGEETYFKITEKGINLLNELEESLVIAANVKDDTDEWIQEWLDMWPKGVKSGGKLLRSDAKSCLLKMRKFRKDYPFDKETIFKATLNYLSQQKSKNWEFTRCAVYFIDKRGEGSDLAAYCGDTTMTVEETNTQKTITSNMTGLV